jgi:hypothetical protein
MRGVINDREHVPARVEGRLVMNPPDKALTQVRIRGHGLCKQIPAYNCVSRECIEMLGTPTRYDGTFV